MSLFPRSVTFARGAVGAALLGALLQPWKILQSTSGFILTWLVGYSALLGPVGGIGECAKWLRETIKET